jgi:hypothetical protein
MVISMGYIFSLYCNLSYQYSHGIGSFINALRINDHVPDEIEF